MFTSHTNRHILYFGVIAPVLAGLIFPRGELLAASLTTVSAGVEFVSPVTITTGNSQPSDDTRLASLAMETTMIRAMTITVDTITNGTADMSNDVRCDYNEGAVTGICNGSGIDVAALAGSSTLQIGPTGNGPDAANSSYEVIVSYQ